MLHFPFEPTSIEFDLVESTASPTLYAYCTYPPSLPIASATVYAHPGGRHLVLFSDRSGKTIARGNLVVPIEWYIVQRLWMGENEAGERVLVGCKENGNTIRLDGYMLRFMRKEDVFVTEALIAMDHATGLNLERETGQKDNAPSSIIVNPDLRRDKSDKESFHSVQGESVQDADVRNELEEDDEEVPGLQEFSHYFANSSLENLLTPLAQARNSSSHSDGI